MKGEKRLRDGAAAEPDADVSGERARMLAEHAAALLLEFDVRGRSLYGGAGCTEILGYTPEELMSL